MTIQPGSFISDMFYFSSKLGDVIANKGIGHVVTFAAHFFTSPLLEPVYKRRRGGWEFQLGGRSYRYFWHRYNSTWNNERAIEVPIVWDEVEKARGKRILEVGNVLSHYYSFEHDVLDKYETLPGVINEDVVDFKPSAPYDLIVSISTLEHVGWDEQPKDPTKIPKAIESMIRWLAPGGRLIVTVPIGYNRDLDDHLRRGTVKFPEQRYLKRTTRDNRWTETRWEDVAHAEYGVPFSRSSCHMLVGVFQAPAAATT